MNKAVLHSVIVLALLLAVTFTFATPMSASEVSLSKETAPLDGVYYIGDTIDYVMTLTNPGGDGATNTLTRIWDTLPNGTVIEFLYPGSPYGETLVQTPGDSHNFTAQYVVAEADLELIVPANPDIDPYWGVLNTFQAEGYDSAGDLVAGLTTRNSRVIWPDTKVTIAIDPSQTRVQPGDSVTLTITEENTGYEPLTNPYVTVYANGSLHATLVAPPDTGDTDADGILDPGETWTWTISSSPITGPTTFTAWGFGTDPLDNDVSHAAGYQGERDEVTVTVFEIPPVGGEALPVSRLTILMPWIALGAALLAGAVVFARRRQALG
jgi:uncharacterized repeat protein (TIGR01451 family)